jgi:hypothetical protein
MSVLLNGWAIYVTNPVLSTILVVTILAAVKQIVVCMGQSVAEDRKLTVCFTKTANFKLVLTRPWSYGH